MLAAVVPTIATRTHLAIGSKRGAYPPRPPQKAVAAPLAGQPPGKAPGSCPAVSAASCAGRCAFSRAQGRFAPRRKSAIAVRLPSLAPPSSPVARFARRLLLLRIASWPLGGRRSRGAVSCLASPRSCLGHTAVPIAAFASRSGGRGKTRRASRIAQNPPADAIAGDLTNAARELGLEARRGNTVAGHASSGARATTDKSKNPRQSPKPSPRTSPEQSAMSAAADRPKPQERRGGFGPHRASPAAPRKARGASGPPPVVGVAPRTPLTSQTRGHHEHRAN